MPRCRGARNRLSRAGQAKRLDTASSCSVPFSFLDCTPERLRGHMTEAFVYDAVRTPRGRGKDTGSLHSVKPVSLVVGLLDEVRKRNVSLDPQNVEDVILGVVSPVGEQGADVARTAALVAGYETSGPGVQLNRFC